MGEIALSGEVRPVGHAALRLKESAKLGFERGWAPKGTEAPKGLVLSSFGKLRELVDQVLAQ
jgi:DNA repair protein RadA/Sms